MRVVWSGREMAVRQVKGQMSENLIGMGDSGCGARKPLQASSKEGRESTDRNEKKRGGKKKYEYADLVWERVYGQDKKKGKAGEGKNDGPRENEAGSEGENRGKRPARGEEEGRSKVRRGVRIAKVMGEFCGIA